MRIVDYENNRNLNDVGIFLNVEEVAELCAYLQRLAQIPDLQHIHLSEISGPSLEREITVSIDHKR